MWRALWKQHSPNKIKLFAWRACHDALTLKANMAQRGIDMQLLCLICANGDEAKKHLFFECEWAMEVWECSGLVIWQQTQTIDSFAGWVDLLWQKLDKNSLWI
ncbi:zf-RVT domain-containing protein [Cephalotus follicularis]|uniref:Zf-RVT domain-containing protein n=1 Tax=Cephalotus follicularis TaxID=3775 RepID=A0A1Q3CF68_CEPFO|nr:zf-RVT domain-containing protein [Cephalotus follicularis]